MNGTGHGFMGQIIAAVTALAMPFAITIFGQVENLSGASGWAGAGLLGLVLAWLLLVHLPNKDKRETALIEAKDKAVAELVKAFKEETSALRSTFKDEAREQRQAFESVIDEMKEQRRP